MRPTNVSHMKTSQVPELRHDTNPVLGSEGSGEPVPIQRCRKTVSILSVAASASALGRPDFEARLKQIYGDKVLDAAATEHLREERGSR